MNTKDFLHLIKLTYKGKWQFLERDYLADNATESLFRIRAALILVGTLYGVFGFLDIRMVPDIKEIAWMIRFAIIVPLTLLTIYLTTRPFFLKYSQLMLFTLCYGGGLGIIAMMALTRAPFGNLYYVGLLLIFITIHSFLQMRFLWASACTLAITISYLIVSLFYISPLKVIRLNNHFFLLSSALICIAAGYLNEVNIRKRYLFQYLLKKEKEKVQRQKEKMELLGTISSGIAHDFNNMLTSLQGYTELSLSETSKDSPVYSYQEEVFRVARRAQAMTRDILTFSRDEPLDLKPVDLTLLIGDVESYIRPLLLPSIRFAISVTTERTIRADEYQMHRILINLCTNALQAMDETGGELTVSAFDTGRDLVAISVADSGPGISAEDRKKIFEPYYSTKKNGKGTGLGLFLVKQLIERFNGSLNLESEPGKGTNFILYFPL